MKLYLVRHGETKLNKEFRFIGRTDVDLSEHGLEQADAIAKRLNAEPIHAVYSSNLKRAIQTAEAIANLHGLQVNHDADLREIDFGNWEGMTYGEIDAVDHANLSVWVNDPINVPIPGGEAWSDFKERVLKSVFDIAAQEKDKHVVVVSHGGPIKLLMSYFHGDDPSFFSSFWPSPGSLSVIEFTQDAPSVLILNDTSYFA